LAGEAEVVEDLADFGLGDWGGGGVEAAGKVNVDVEVLAGAKCRVSQIHSRIPLRA